MKNVFKYLKRSRFAILFVFLLLILQAYCDLSLPKYTSNMVNIGIQQSGITSPVPEVIRKSKLDNLLLFASSKEKNKVKTSYQEIKQTKENIKKYPILKKEKLYLLKDNNNLDNFFSNALMLDSYLTKNNQSYEVIKQLPISELNNIKEKVNKIESSIKNQAAIALIKDEYKQIGIDTDNMQTDYIVKTGFFMLLLALTSMVLTIVVSYFAAKISSLLGQKLRKDVFDKVLSFSESEFKNFKVSSLITRNTNDITQVQMLTVMLLRIVFYAPIMAIGGIFMVLNTNTKMTWIIAVAVAIILFLVITLFIIAMPKFKILQKLIDQLNLVSREILSGLSVIRAFNREKYEEKKFNKANTDLMKVNLFINKTMAIMMPVMMLVMNLIMVTIVWVGARHIDSGNMQVGDMMAFMQYTMEIVMSFLMISIVSVIMPRALVSLNRIDEVIKTKNTIIDPDKPKRFNRNKKGLIEFKNVSFRYPEAKQNVISNISFTCENGKTTALIGSTGSGKSTVINLIPRFFEVTEGEILVEGVNIKDVKMKDLRDKIGFVPQKGVLFSGTIKSNITYGVNKASKEDIEKSLKISQAENFVSKLENGIDSKVSQTGKNVSGGERQRLSIARAIMKNPDIYIFDDSFSALDFKTDAIVRKELKKITKDKTVIIVAQRISTIMNADQIIVLDEGKIVSIGTHKELMESCEIYRQIALSQLSKEALDA